MKAVYASEGQKLQGKGQPSEEEVMEHSLNEDEIRQILPGIKIFPYPELYDYDTIDEVFDSKGRALMLYLTENETTGHWVCMLKKGKEIEYFDPYGKFGPDGYAGWLSHHKLKELGQAQPRLSEMLKASPYTVTKNPYAFQKKEDDVNTCGRHCVTRLALSNLPLDKYKDLVTSTNYTPDKFVSYYTWDKLKK